MAHRARFGCAVTLVLVALAAGCGDDGDEGADAMPEAVECVNLPECAVEVSETEGLADGDVISVRVEGFEPDASIAISQCEDPEDSDNADLEPGPDGLPPADVCNVEGLPSAAQSASADADGVVAFDYEVRAGDRMVEESVSGECNAEHDCRLHVFLSFDLRLRSDAPRVEIPMSFA